MNKPVYIYLLIDPNTNKIRYVGQSINPKKRFQSHIDRARIDTKSHVKAWIKSLLLQDQRPILKIIEKVPLETSWKTRERFWISYYRKRGEPLTNMTTAGEGSPNRPAWNKGTKGVMKANAGSAKPGEHRSPDTEIKPGQRLSPATEFKKGQIPFNAKKVGQYSLEGKLVATFSSATAAAKSVGLTQGGISKAIREKTYTAKFFWLFSDSPPQTIEIKTIESKPGKPSIIDKYSLDDKLLARYTSVREAARANNMSHQTLYSYFHRNGNIAGGYKWKRVTISRG